MDLFRHLRAGPARGKGPSVAERALDGSRYRERGAHTEPECCRRDWPKKPEDDGGNAWRGVFSPAPAPLSGRLAVRSAAARLLPCYCYDVEARSACSSNLPLHRDLRRNHSRWQPGSATETGPHMTQPACRPSSIVSLA